MLGTSQPQLSRLERGERRLTVEWMTRIAKALDVEPVDLLSIAALSIPHDDVVPHEPSGLGDAASALMKKGFHFYTVRSNSLEQLKIAPGDVLLFDTTPEAIRGIKTGDVALVSLTYKDRQRETTRLVIRQFVAPNLLTTNRHRGNVILTMGADGAAAEIVGILMPSETHS